MSTLDQINYSQTKTLKEETNNMEPKLKTIKILLQFQNKKGDLF